MTRKRYFEPTRLTFEIVIEGQSNRDAQEWGESAEKGLQEAIAEYFDIGATELKVTVVLGEAVKL